MINATKPLNSASSTQATCYFFQVFFLSMPDVFGNQERRKLVRFDFQADNKRQTEIVLIISDDISRNRADELRR